MARFQFNTGSDEAERFKAIYKDFNLITDYKDKLNLYLENSDFLSLTITEYSHYTESEEEIDIYITPKTEEERRLFNIICCCPNLAKNYELEQYDNYDFEGVLSQCIEKEKAEIDRTIKENSLPMEYVEAEIKFNKNKLEDSNCHRIKNGFDDRTIEMQVYDSLLRRETINYDYFLSKEIEGSKYFNDIYHSVVRLGFGIINAHTLHFLEGELNKLKNPDYLKEILQNQKLGLNPTTTPATEQQNFKEKNRSVNEVITEINNAFFRLEKFMQGNIKYYDYYGFNNAFTQLFDEVKKPKNYTIENCELIDKYWFLIQQISFDFDKSEFDNLDAYDNEAFCKDCNEMDILMDRVEEFIYFGGEEEESKVSISDIVKNKPLANGMLKVTPATEQPINKKSIKEKPVISFKTMFKNPLDYEKVLGYISEYLTDAKQWKENIVYSTAFYGVLRDKGYLNNIYKAPQINNALKNEFGIICNDKNFQNAKINDAVATYAEAFNMIPSLKSTK